MSWLGQARKRNQRLGAIPYDQGTNTPRRLDLRNSGYVDRLRMWQNFTGTYSVAPTGTDAFAALGGALGRITVMANSVGLLFDCTGNATKVITAIDGHQRTDRSGNFTDPNDVFTTSPGTSAFADLFNFDVPISVNLVNKPWPLGFFQTALNSQETSIEARFLPGVATAGTPGSGVYLGGTPPAAFGGNLDIDQLYFDPIADPQSQPSLAFVHQWREYQAPLTADGDTEFRLNPSNYYMRVLIAVVTGGAGALAPDNTHVTRLRLMYGANLAPYDEVFNQLMDRAYQSYGFNLPTGWYVEDFFNDTSTEQDWINSAATTDLRLNLTMSGATYSGGAYVKIAVEQLIPLVIPRAGSQGVQGTANAPA